MSQLGPLGRRWRERGLSTRGPLRLLALRSARTLLTRFATSSRQANPVPVCAQIVPAVPPRVPAPALVACQEAEARAQEGVGLLEPKSQAAMAAHAQAEAKLRSCLDREAEVSSKTADAGARLGTLLGAVKDEAALLLELEALVALEKAHDAAV